MRKYFCDVCGKEFDPAAANHEESYGAKAACPSVLDACPDCAALGRTLDVQALVLAAWRSRAGAGAVQEETAAAPEPMAVQDTARDSGDSHGTMPEPAAVPGTAPEPGEVPDGRDGTGCGTVPTGQGTSMGPQDPDAASAGTTSVPDAGPAAGTGTLQGSGWKAYAPPGAKPRGSRGPAKPEGARKSGGPGSHWAEKRETMDRLQAYRKNGGTTHGLAEKAGLSPDTVRAMLEAKQRPIDEWRAVKRALDKLEAGS